MASSSGQQPSQDAFASIVTQVSNTGQPARGPSRPVRPRQGQGQRKPSTKAAATSTSNTATSTTPASSSSQAKTDATAGTSASVPAPAPVASDTTTTSTSKPIASSVAATTTTASPPSTGQSSTNKAKSTTATTQEAAPTASSSAAGPSPPSPKARQLQKSNSNNAGGSSALNKQQQHHNNKKRKSWFSSMFSSCFTGGSAHDEDNVATGVAAENNNAASMSERKAGTANATRPVTSTSTSSSTSPNRQNVGTSTSSSAQAPATATTAADGKHAKKDASLLDKKKNDERMIKVIPDTTSATNPSNSQHHGAAGLALDTAAGAGAGAVAAGGLLHPISSSSEGNETAGSNVTRGISSSPHSEIAPEVLAANQTGGTPLSRDETADVLSGAVQAPGSEGLTPKKEKRRKSSSGERTHGQQHDENASGDVSRVSSLSSDEETGDESADRSKDNEEALAEDSEEEEYVDEEERIIAAGGMGIPVDEHGNPAPLLKELTPSYKGKKCLVLDLDETLVHSSFKLIHSPDFVVPVEIENTVHSVYVIKRPGVDAFMKRMGEIYEVVVFTASLSKYADPVLDQLDIHHVVKHRLFRESCYNHRGNYVKDLSQLGREIGDTIIIDNSPASYIFHPNNAVPVSSWFNDPHDTELTDLQGFLADLADVPDVRGVLDGGLFPPQ